jgi:energy-coupling factor transporter ATP-binding protein EcfA2
VPGDSPGDPQGSAGRLEEAVVGMEGQGVAPAGAPGEFGAGSVVAAEFRDPGASHGGEGQERNGDDTVVMPAQDHPANGDPAEPGDEPRAAQPSPGDSSVPPPAPATEPPTVVMPAIPAEPAPPARPPAGYQLPADYRPVTPAQPPQPATAAQPLTPPQPPSAAQPGAAAGSYLYPETGQPRPESSPPASPAQATGSHAAGSHAAGPEAAGSHAAAGPEAAGSHAGAPETARPEPPALAEPAALAEPTPAAPPSPAAQAAPAAPADLVAPAQPHVRVDARLLEAALLNLRKRIAAIPLVFEIPGAAQVKTERTKLLSQIDDYLLPRVRRSAAPVLVALVGSTGAGKSTLVNSIVGAHVSATGVRRPTTNSPVLACHPDDIDWFAENNFLPTLPRVRQEGLARPGRDGLLVLAASEGMPRGIALLDTPDIDSVVQAHHEFAYKFLDASDLWLFMTSASRYADGPVWEILQHARDRRASLGVVLSRIPQAHRTELVGHFTAMLDANGITAENRFVIPEIPLIDGMLPPDAYQPVRDWLADTAARADRRVAVLTQTMSGVLDTFKTRVPAMAAHVEAQVVLTGELRRSAEAAYERAFAEASAGLKNGTLLGGEVLARWQDCLVGGDLQPRRGGKSKGQRTGAGKKGRRARRGQSRPVALNTSLRSALESFIVSIADRAAEHVDGHWRANSAGAVLLADAAAERARGERAKQIFESAFGSGSGTDGSLAGGAQGTQATVFSRSSPDLQLRAARAVGAWQDHLTRLVEAEGFRPAAKRASFDEEALSLVVLVAMLGADAPGADTPATGPEGTSIDTEPRRLLTSVFGAVELTEILTRARTDLLDRVRLLLDEELVRFVEVIDAAGPCDDVAAIRLYQAEFSLEAVR